MRGRNGADNTFLDCKGSPLIAHDSIDGLKLRLEGIHVANARRAGSGAVLNARGASSRVNIRACVFTNCSTLASGGVVHMSGGDLQVSWSKFDFNSAHVSGGSLSLVDGATALVVESSFTSNFAEGIGGAVRLQRQCTLTMNKVEMTLNIVGVDGGAIALTDESQLSATGLSISNGMAAHGGAIHGNSNSVVRLNHTRIFNNDALSTGGGLSITFGAMLHLSDGVEIFDCFSTLAGGVALSYAANLISEGDVKIFRCSAQIYGGGIIMVEGVTAHIHSGLRLQNNFVFSAGGGMLMLFGSIVIATGNIVFDGNVAYGNGGGESLGGGGGMVIDGATPVNIFLDGITMRNNVALDGAGIYIRNNPLSGSIKIINTIFSNNRASLNGGGMYVDKNHGLILSNITCRNNTAKNGLGGGMYIATESSGTISHSLFVKNLARQGGGFAASGKLRSDFSISASLFQTNTALLEGGGIYTGGAAHVSLSNSTTVEGCLAGSNGGGVATRNNSILEMQDPVVIRGCDATATTEGMGGGMFAAGSKITISGPLVIQGNKAGQGGGVGFFSQIEFAGKFTSTISNNHASGDGGGAYASRWAGCA